MTNHPPVSIQLDKVNMDKETLKRILDFLPYPFLVSELRNSRRYNAFVNEKFLEEIGFTVEEMPTNDDWFVLAYPDPVYRQQIKDEWASRTLLAQKAGEDSVFLQALIHTKKSGSRWYEVKSSISGSLYLVAFVDIHDVRAREEQLERANQNKDKILSVLGHDLRGPIRNLNKLSSLMLEGDVTAEEFTQMVKNINEKSFQSLEFLDTTLLWTKSNFDKISVHIEKVFPYVVTSHILPLYRGSADFKKISITLNVSEAVFIYSDVEILTIVLRNLISNAIKFTNEKGSIVITAFQKEDFFVIAVKDSGIGMDKQTIRNIFDDNYTSSVGTNQETGLGLGLKLCRELLKQISGSLEIESVKGAGTTMKILVKNNTMDY